MKNIHAITTNLEKAKANTGDCEADDEECKKESVALVSKPADEKQL
jgi:hypothetical protein